MTNKFNGLRRMNLFYLTFTVFILSFLFIHPTFAATQTYTARCSIPCSESTSSCYSPACYDTVNFNIPSGNTIKSATLTWWARMESACGNGDWIEQSWNGLNDEGKIYINGVEWYTSNYDCNWWTLDPGGSKSIPASAFSVGQNNELKLEVVDYIWGGGGVAELTVTYCDSREGQACGNCGTIACDG